MGILETIIDSNQSQILRDFDPSGVVSKVLQLLKERDRKVLAKRHGLAGESQTTLETIGKELGLTRERVRQIERQLLLGLKQQVKSLEEFQKHSELLHSTISSHGGLMAEADLLEMLGVQAVAEANAARFLLFLTEGVSPVKPSGKMKGGWKTAGFSERVFHDFLDATHEVLKQAGKPHSAEKLLDILKETKAYKEHFAVLSEKVMRNFFKTAHFLDQNPLQEYGLKHWPDISPHDVGDKAYLALKSHGKPAHYTEITKLANALGFSGRRAHEETLHNELIKDSRFVLVGRGIYALAEWGFAPGVVVDVITEVLKAHGGQMKKEDLVEAVMQRRMVKRNTILVNLANRKKFVKLPDGKYGLA